MQNSSILQIAKRLKQQRKKGKKSAIFIGAGVSVTAGIPTANGIVDFVKGSEVYSGTVPSDSVEYFDVMSKLTPNERSEILEHHIYNSEINRTHLIISLLVNLGFVDTIITTNFDPIITNTFSFLQQDIERFDLANSHTHLGKKLPKPVICHLHGRSKSYWELNTLDLVKNKEDEIQDLINRTSSESTWIIVGYSGNDPVFDAFKKIAQFDHDLYWVGYKDELPNKKVQNFLKDKINSTYFVSGYDSDNFFETLIDRLGLSEDIIAFVRDAFLHSEKRIQRSKIDEFEFTNNLYVSKLTQDCKKWISKILETRNALPFTNLSYFDKLKLLVFSNVTNIDKAQYLIVKSRFEDAITILKREVRFNPLKFELYFYLFIAYSGKAESINAVSDRIKDYKVAREYYEYAFELVTNDSEEKEVIEKNLKSYWAEEFNSGVNILTDDSLNTATPQPNETALSHFQNALAINPDSSRTYQVISSIYFNMGNTEEAISYYEDAIEILDNPAKEDYEYLISLYLQNGPYDKAIELAQQAKEYYPDETLYVQFQADAYIQSGERDRAIELVQGLIEQDPDNPQYRRVLGTQVYQDVTRISNEVTDLYGEMFELNQELRNLEGAELEEAEQEVEEIQSQITEMETQIDELVDLSAQEMKKVVELEPEDESANSILGNIYQNSAASHFERCNNSEDNEESQKYDEMARKNLHESLVYYERAAKLNPDNSETLKSLFQVYTTLGMEEKAKEVVDKADM